MNIAIMIIILNILCVIIFERNQKKKTLLTMITIEENKAGGSQLTKHRTL